MIMTKRAAHAQGHEEVEGHKQGPGASQNY